MESEQNLPRAFAERMRRLLGADAPRFFEAMQEEPVRALRLNRGKAEPERLDHLLPFATYPIPFDPCGRYFSYDGVGNLPLHHAGAFYVQEPAAMAAAAAIDPMPDWKILDLCAAPGGKTARAASFLGERGMLLANEIIPSRMKILTSNVERMGFRNVVTTCATTRQICDCYPAAFDLVIADVPCSGEGMLRKSEAARREWSEENVLACARRAAEILENAAAAVAPGGYLLFSTCTFSLEENEEQVVSFLTLHPDFSLAPVREEVRAVTAPGVTPENCPFDLSLTRRFYPHLSPGEGQFVALLRREENAPRPVCRLPDSTAPLSAGQRRQMTDAIGTLLPPDVLERARLVKETVILPPDALPLPKGAFCCGVTAGTLQKNYFLPHHQLFSAYGNEMSRRLELAGEDERISAYLAGETVSCDLPDGWCAVLVEGCALGGGKVVGGQLKNHYPKGLRRPF